MDRDRNIAMGLGSNTNAAAMSTSHIKRASFFEPDQIFLVTKETVMELSGTKIEAFNCIAI